MARTVTVRPQTISPETLVPLCSTAKRKVAAYARVSTEHEEQQTSYEAQCEYYTAYIRSRPDWEFAGIYADEGVTGTSTKHRDGFNRMVSDALAGKVDLILTKSVSRFARNTVDSLTTIRLLKAHGTEVFFEKENIWTFDSKGELLISIMSSLSQEESRSISENVKWGQRKKFADGRFSLTYSHFLGYDRGDGDTLVINEEEAKIVRLIYSDFFFGFSPGAIARRLTEQGIRTPGGKKQWSAATVRSILQNEKYRGSALLQKSFTPDFLTRRSVKNRGELPQYYIEKSHPAIIPPEQFDLVQKMIKDKKKRGGSLFTGKIRCGECGGTYGPKVWHSADQYRRVVWQCNAKFHNAVRCRTPHLTEEGIKAAFVKAANKLTTEDRDFCINELRAVMKSLFDSSALETGRGNLDSQAEGTAPAVRDTAAENARTEQEKEDLGKEYEAPAARSNAIAAQCDTVSSRIVEAQVRREKTESFIRQAEEMPGLITEFDACLWASLVESMTVRADGQILFRLTCGKEIKV